MAYFGETKDTKGTYLDEIAKAAAEEKSARFKTMDSSLPKTAGTASATGAVGTTGIGAASTTSAPGATGTSGIDWNAIYNEELNKIADPTEQINALKSADIGALDTAKAAQELKLGQTRDESLRQAYVTREMNRKDLPAIMSNMGLTGGITETAANDLLRDYRNTSNSARRSYDTSATDLANTYGTNVANLNSTYGQRILEALANRQATATNSANIRAQIAQAEAAAAEAQRQAKVQEDLAREQWEWQKSQSALAAAAAAAPVAAAGTGGYTGPEKEPNNASKPMANKTVGAGYGTNYSDSGYKGTSATKASTKPYTPNWSQTQAKPNSVTGSTIIPTTSSTMTQAERYRHNNARIGYKGS